MWSFFVFLCSCFTGTQSSPQHTPRSRRRSGKKEERSKARVAKEGQSSPEILPKGETTNRDPREILEKRNISNTRVINTDGKGCTGQQKKKKQDTMIPKTFRFDLGMSEINFDAPSISIAEETTVMIAQQHAITDCNSERLYKVNGNIQKSKGDEDAIQKILNANSNCTSNLADCKTTKGIEMKCAKNGVPSSSVAPNGYGSTILCSQSSASSETVSQTFADLVDRWISEESSLETLPPNVATSVRFD